MVATIKRRKRRKPPQFKSGLEVKVSKLIPNPELYETVKLTYVQEHTYTPDFPLADGVTFIEAKGYWDAADRAKHLRIKESYPDYRVVFVFANSRNKLNRSSKTTYGDWCNRHGFHFCDIKELPDKIKEWI